MELKKNPDGSYGSKTAKNKPTPNLGSKLKSKLREIRDVDWFEKTYMFFYLSKQVWKVLSFILGLIFTLFGLYSYFFG